ncbi:histone h1/h5, putative [Ricinus communis]|uniref:Histone h1/h5, putative n=1 Tax=Ricinus communis TaxID=3988 RepID=B9T8C7_RICCO|nr:histone h1/h5, putative [Ricinus communis]
MDPPPPPLPQPPFFQLPPATITAAAVPSAASTQIIPPSPPVTAEAAAAHNHVAHAANATAPTVAQSFNHPPYTDMIYAAITALKERDGSSKRAIAKYIERVYPGLPPTHSALLTHHLKRLKNTGLLVMVKKSYKLPRSDDTVATNNINSSTSNNINAVGHSALPPNPAVTNSGPKRGRGRPPKPKPEVVPSSIQPISQPNAASVMVPVGLSISTQPINSAPAATVIQPPNVGQPQMGVKRGRGRPKKVAGGGAAAAVLGGKRRGRPPKSAGRPKKLKSVGANGVKKGPKRLPKSVVVPYATGAAAAVTARPRGRPKKGAAPAAAPGVGGVVGIGGAVVVPGKRAGRPPKVVGGVVVNPKKRPVGRPKKNDNVSWAAAQASQLQSEAYGDLKMKFEFFQSKVRQAVGVLRPQLTNETPISVVAAIQELILQEGDSK